MNITIKPLTPELAADYFDFFENRAFTDDSPYRCYCQVYQMTKEQYQAAYNDPEVHQNPGPASRKVAEWQIDDGVLRGIWHMLTGDQSVGAMPTTERITLPNRPMTMCLFMRLLR